GGHHGARSRCRYLVAHGRCGTDARRRARRGGAVSRRSRWRIRLAGLLPRRSRWKVRSRALGPRWRPFVEDAATAEDRYHAAVRRLEKGPLRDRLEVVGRDVATAVDQTWQVASAGQDLTDARAAIDVADILAELERSDGAAAETRRRQLEI